MTRKTLMLGYALGAYFLAAGNLIYIMGFLADLGVPKGIGDGEPGSLWEVLLIDAGLLGSFGLHHSITARTSFKRWWTKIVPPPIERATYLYMTAAMTALLIFLWRPIPISIWEFRVAWQVVSFYTAYVAIWAMMLAATFHFGHFGFFGLAQVWSDFRACQPAATPITVRYLYALVRHPISLGWMIAPLATPHLTVGHLVFAGATAAYILVATRFEESDLIRALGKSYRDYRERVPSFIPFLNWRRTRH